MSKPADLGSWMDHAPVLLWRAARNGAWIWAGSRWCAYTGLSEAESLGEGWLEALHPEDRARTLRAFSAAAANGGLQRDHRIRDASGAFRWHRTRAELAGHWSGASLDIDDLKRARDESESELAETRRRMRNTLGVVRTIARRTAETSASVESCAMHFEGRLDALARVEARIARNGGGGVPLETLAAEEIAVFLAREDARLAIAGPPVLVRPEAAETLALMFHELSANAIKFGALSPLGGRLKVSWALEGERTLRISWVETGVPLKGPPRSDGFGADLFKRGLAYSLRARADFALRRDGLVCTVEIPLETVAA